MNGRHPGLLLSSPSGCLILFTLKRVKDEGGYDPNSNSFIRLPKLWKNSDVVLVDWYAKGKQDITIIYTPQL
jgi:hypothetical protein